MLTPAALAATLIAGLLSFFQPCSVPLLPAYLACVSGVSARELSVAATQHGFRTRLLAGTLLFVAGFTVVFILLGVGAGGISGVLRGLARPLEIVGGVLLIGFGLITSGLVHGDWLFRERHLELPERIRSRGLAAAFPLGVVFGFAWTPCVGPYLAAALALAAASAHALSGAVLLAVYALGLGLPFVGVALVWASLPDVSQRLSRWAPWFARAGSLLTVLLGVLLATGQYSALTSRLAQLSVGY